MSAGDIYILTVATHTVQQLTTSNNSITPVWSPIGNTSTIASSPNNASSAQVTSANSLCHPSGYCVDIPIGWEGQFDHPRPNNLILSHENLRIAVELTHFEGLDQMSAPEIETDENWTQRSGNGSNANGFTSASALCGLLRDTSNICRSMGKPVR